MLQSKRLLLPSWWNKFQFAGCWLNSVCDICGWVGRWETHRV